MGGPTAAAADKFRVYENAAVTAALRERSVRPSSATLLAVVACFLASASGLVRLCLHRDAAASALAASAGVSRPVAAAAVTAAVWVAGAVCVAATSALCKVLYVWDRGSSSSARTAAAVGFRRPGGGGGGGGGGYPAASPGALWEHQQVLLGFGSKRQQAAAENGGGGEGWAGAEGGGGGAVTTGSTGTRLRPPRTRAAAAVHASPPPVMVPLHPSSATKGARTAGGVPAPAPPWAGGGGLAASPAGPAGTAATPVTPYRGQASSSPYGGGASGVFASPASVKRSPAAPEPVAGGGSSSPWARGGEHPWDEAAAITNEERLEEFISDVQTKMLESSSSSYGMSTDGFRTPPPTLQGAGGGSNGTNYTPRSASSSTPQRTQRPLKMSPIPHKPAASPKKGHEGDFPPPMSPEQVAEAMARLGVAGHIEQWRDGLRQWVSAVLLNPLVAKIDASHVQVAVAAAKLGVSVAVAQVGSSSGGSGSRGGGGGRVLSSSSDGAGAGAASASSSSREWQSTFAPDDDVVLHQLRVALVQALVALPARSATSTFGLHPPEPPAAVNPAVRECLDAVTEHQRLKALMEGEWVKGLVPHAGGGWKAEHAVRRVRELAEGTCVKRYDFLGGRSGASGGGGGVGGPSYDMSSSSSKEEHTPKRMPAAAAALPPAGLLLPADSHLLLYLFCALLEHPQWMLHVDPTAHPSTQCGSNPLYVARMPDKEVFPEKYVAVLAHPPHQLLHHHMGACVLAVSKHASPVFALYWDKKPQFALQGRTALWDAILLLCYRIKVAHAGVVRGVSLGSAALNLLPLLDTSSPPAPAAGASRTSSSLLTN